MQEHHKQILATSDPLKMLSSTISGDVTAEYTTTGLQRTYRLFKPSDMISSKRVQRFFRYIYGNDVIKLDRSAGCKLVQVIMEFFDFQPHRSMNDESTFFKMKSLFYFLPVTDRGLNGTNFEPRRLQHLTVN